VHALFHGGCRRVWKLGRAGPGRVVVLWLRGSGSGSDSRAGQSSAVSRQSLHTTGTIDVAHRDTQPICLMLELEMEMEIQSFHYHCGARSTRPPIQRLSLSSEQARLVTPAQPKSYVVYNMQRPYQYDCTGTAQSSSFPSQCICTSIIQSQA
jgi:hypothetical protein